MEWVIHREATEDDQRNGLVSIWQASHESNSSLVPTLSDTTSIWLRPLEKNISSGDIPNSPRSPRRTSWNSRGILVEFSWNPGGTLVEPYLRATPDHPGAYLG